MDFLNPVFTNFSKRLLYNTYDISGFVSKGVVNIVTIDLGNGFYNFQPETSWSYHTAPWRDRPSFLADIKGSCSEAMTTLAETDSSWEIFTSPWIFNAIYLGETYDQGLEIDGIYSEGFEASNSQNALEVTQPDIAISKQGSYEAQVFDTLDVVRIIERSPTNKVAHFPRNIAGVIQVRLTPSTPGQKIFIKYGEQLAKSGRVLNEPLTENYTLPVEDELFQTDILMLDDTTMSFTPRFSYKGFQYVEFSSEHEILLELQGLKALAVTSIPEKVSLFHSENDLINSLWEASNNSFQANFIGFPTDCPTLEKNGWTGEGHLVSRAVPYAFEVKEIYEKWLTDHRDAMLSNGSLPLIVPSPGWGYQNESFDWTYSIIEVPWQMYLFYGDREVLSANYDAMSQHVRYWIEKSVSNIISSPLGDWKSNSSSNKAFIASTFLYDALRKMAQVAEILGRASEADWYFRQAEFSLGQIRSTFYNPDVGTFGNGTAPEVAIGLFYELYGSSAEKKILEQQLIQLIESDLSIELGVIGTYTVLRTLTASGNLDLALRLVARDNASSWGQWLKSDGSTLFEGYGFEPDNFWYGGSMNHMFFGSINEWIVQDLVGISPIRDGAGFSKVLLSPGFSESIGSMDFDFTTPSGSFNINWNYTDAGFEYEVSGPAEVGKLLRIPKGYYISTINGLADLGPNEMLDDRSLKLANAGNFEIVFTTNPSQQATVSRPRLFTNGVSIFVQIPDDLSGEELSVDIYDFNGRLLRKWVSDADQSGVIEILKTKDLTASGSRLVIARLRVEKTGFVESIKFYKG